MPNLQFIRHQLINMLTMRLSQILMQHNTMTNSQASIHAIHQQENQPSNITSRKNKRTYQEQQDIRHTYRAHITRETLRLTLRTEIKAAKHNIRKNHDINHRLVHKSH